MSHQDEENNDKSAFSESTSIFTFLFMLYALYISEFEKCRIRKFSNFYNITEMKNSGH